MRNAAPALSPAILLALTAVTGIVDAVSFLALGHVFTANMTGNVAFLGFALGGASGLSIRRSVLALFAFMAGAVAGGRIVAKEDTSRWVVQALTIEAILLLGAADAGLGLTVPAPGNALRIGIVIAFTAIAMGIRNAAVRKLAVPDLTTTVLTLTVTGLVAESALAGGTNPRWLRRGGAVFAMLGGAAAGALLLRRSVALALLVSGVMTAGCAAAAFYTNRKEGSA